MSDLHSVDVEPAGDHASHRLLVNGAIVVRYDTLEQALEARRFFLEPFSSDAASEAAADLTNPKTEKRSSSSHGINERLSDETGN
jgi:hypothetical protein